jgi:hypothetical protein
LPPRKKKQYAHLKAKSLSPTLLAEQAQQALERGRFRDAIEHFKALLKLVENHPEHQAGLAAAYAGRARELSAKGMLKEALVIWDNRRQFCPQVPVDPEQITALLQGGRASEALRLLRQVTPQLDPARVTALRVQLAALNLSGLPGLDQELAPDDPVLLQGVPARAALDAYCRGDDAAVARALAAIPFRSPYRDWVQALKALLRLPEDGKGASTLLQRISPDSPFAPLARAIGLALLSESAAPQALAATGAAAQAFAAALRGWPLGRLALWQEFQALGERPATADLENILHRHRALLGEAWVQRQGLRLLIEGYPRSLKHSRLFARRGLASADKNLVAAWHAEEQGDVWAALHAWKQIIQELRHPADPPPGSDDALRIALIQRHLNQYWKLLEQQPNDPHEDLAAEARDLLEESLVFDPDDLPTYLRLIAHYRTGRRLKDARRLLDAALGRWPDDLALLGEALDTATASEAFKKASGYARRMLVQDPINRRARDSLLQAHLAHARKQIRGKHFERAERELAAAAEWARDERAQLRLGAVRGFLLLERNGEEGKAALRALVQRAGGGLSGQLLLALEAVRMGKELKGTMRKLDLAHIGQPEPQDLRTFLRELREVLDQGGKLPQTVPNYFASALQQAKDLPLPQGECEALCETLRRCNLDQVRLAHAQAALRRWPGQPIFELHAFEARHGDLDWQAAEEEIERLEQAHQRARQSGDSRTAYRIGELLERATFSLPSRMPPLGSPPEGMQELIDEIGIEGLVELMKQFGETSRDIREMEAMLGQEGIHALFEVFLTGRDPKDLDNMPFPPHLDPFRRRPPRPDRKPRRTSTSAPKRGKDDAPPPDQPDPFE